MAIAKGDKIKVDYTGTLEDGTVFDSSEKHGKPLEFEVGAGQLIKGFDEAVVGMEKGQEKEIKLEASEAYGELNPEMVKQVPKEQLPKDKELKPGMMLVMGLPNGAQLPAKITEVGDDTVTIDINHPLAGKALNFKIKIVDIIS
ncbi:peptidylprolyl isomerase [Nanoarchaeota archaeon]